MIVMLVRSSDGQSDRPLSGRTAVQIRAGQPYAGTCAGRLVARPLTFNQVHVGSIPTRRTSRVLKRELVTQLAGYQPLKLDCAGSSPAELTIRGVSLTEKFLPPNQEMRVQFLHSAPSCPNPTSCDRQDLEVWHDSSEESI